jgi:hypothetical protein
MEDFCIVIDAFSLFSHLLNIFSHTIIDQAMFQPVFGQINACKIVLVASCLCFKLFISTYVVREKIGLLPLTRVSSNFKKAPFLYCYSSALCPPPKDWPFDVRVLCSFL